MRLFDSVKKQKIDFVPLVENKVKIYVCGPTVYDDAHLGHARSAIVFDLLRRVLKKNGYEVMMAKNFTDIDDKIIKKAKEQNKSLEEITTHYIDLYLKDMESIGVLRPDLEPKATQNVDAMIELIEHLLEQNIAYKVSNGDVYLDVSNDSKYGTLSGRGDELELKSRIKGEEEKKSQRDFVLWKTYKDDEKIGYEAPFGKGRPGWHIECSAMIEKLLAYKDSEFQIDIHGGGEDLLFPHHENEASQTRCATKTELAKYWIHNGFVSINGEKMSKSLGNSFFLKDALNVYDGEILRNYLISTHYRSTIDFNDGDLIASKKRLDKLYRLKNRLYGVKSGEANKEFAKNILDALNDDMNVSVALSVVDSMVNDANTLLDNAKSDKSQIVANIELVGELLGIGQKDAVVYFQLGVSEEDKKIIEDKILQRLEAKKNKDFNTADKIRDELKNMKISLLDTSSGTIWERMEI